MWRYQQTHPAKRLTNNRKRSIPFMQRHYRPKPSAFCGIDWRKSISVLRFAYNNQTFKHPKTHRRGGILGLQITKFYKDSKIRSFD